MKTPTEVLRQIILRDPAIWPIVRGNVYPDTIPAGVADEQVAIAYHVTSDRREDNLGGKSDLSIARVELEIVGPRRDQVDEIGVLVEKAIEGQAGDLPTERTGETLYVDSIVADNTYATDSPARPGSDNPRRRRVLNLVVAYHWR